MKYLYLSASIAGLLFGGSAVAQDVVDQASAQQLQAQAAGFDDIVVTARRRAEPLQDVPVAITALSGQALQEMGVRSTDDLQKALPGVNVSGQRRDDASFYIRGQGPGIFSFGQRNFTSVATYFAEVPALVSGPGVFFDLSGVQILKGPQGTLFGRNTTGGAVLFEPQRPTQKIEGYVQLSAGNYGYRELEAVMNLPISPDLLSIRLAGNVAERHGFTTSVLTGQHLDGRDYQAYRASILFTPAAGLENLTIIDGRVKDQSGTSAVIRQVNPASPTGALIAPYLAQQRALGVRRTLLPVALYDRQSGFGVTNKTTWEASDAITLKNIVSFRRNRVDQASDFDGTPVNTFFIENVPGERGWQIGQEQFTEEFQVQGKVPSMGLEYIVGYYHELTKPGFPQEVRQSLSGNVSVRRLDYRDQSDALFAHAEIDLTNQFQLSGGFRYTWDKRAAGIGVFNTAGDCTQRVPAGTGPITCPFEASGKFKAPSYDATIQYKPMDRVLAYLSYRRGYKSGGLNLPSPAPEFTAFRPEHVDSFEAGLKADWNVGVPLRTNLSAFIDKYKDIQISQPVVIPGVAITSLVQNAGKATNKGFEFEGSIRPLEILTINGFVSYLDAHSNVTVPGTAAIKGRQTAFQPKWKYGVSGKLDLPVSDALGTLGLSVDYSWQGKVNTNETNAAYLTTYPSYGLLGARVELKDVARSGIDLAVFGSNLTNKTYILGGFPLTSSLGFESAYYGEPRMYGISARMRFGN
ncbi:TonB-dependent receptor [Sphingobium sp. EM0848]|uniref:TonB-dependent receptor n=1 Tax=Sphingobium sp. EM0848 TaxID=2743473 RepID=UPI001C3FB07B|nr:TonB-dependent receptor [Sphingobium sp. EM0848]